MAIDFGKYIMSTGKHYISNSGHKQPEPEPVDETPADYTDPNEGVD